jgi:hypothetical protein
MASYLVERLLDADLSPEEVDTLDAECSELAEPKACVGRRQHESSVTRVDRIGELRDLPCLEEPLLVIVLDLRQLDAVARCPHDEAGLHRTRHRDGEKLVSLPHRPVICDCGRRFLVDVLGRGARRSWPEMPRPSAIPWLGLAAHEHEDCLQLALGQARQAAREVAAARGGRSNEHRVDSFRVEPPSPAPPARGDVL